MAIAAMFAVACSKDDDNKKEEEKPEEKPQEQTYTGPEQGTSAWSVIGALNEEAVKMNWDADLVLAASGDNFVLKNLKLTAADEFKIRENKDWGNNRGGDFAKLGEGFEVANNGANIKPGIDGLVDVWYNPAKEQMAVCEPGKAPVWKESAGPVAAAITIDGDFADWAALEKGTYSQTYGDEDATHPALTHAKVYADADFVYVYFEWDTEYTEPVPDVDHVPFHCYINTDGDATTGGFADQFADACTDVLLEGFIYPDGVSVGSYDPTAYAWVGEANGSGWGWSEDILPDGGACEGAGIEGKYEFKIDRSVIAGIGFPIADVFSIGFDIQQNWDSVGILPNSHVTDDNPGGLAPSLQVTTVKK